MKQDAEFGYKTRQVLNKDVDSLEARVVIRLQEARQKALNMQRAQVHGLRLAGLGHSIELAVYPYATSLLAAMALVIGATGTYYWNAFEQAQEYEEVDSALLADELPPSAYLDRGFHAWLENASDSSSQ